MRRLINADYHEKRAENYKKWIEKPENQEKRKAWRKEYDRNPEKTKMRYVRELNDGKLDYTRESELAFLLRSLIKRSPPPPPGAYFLY